MIQKSSKNWTRLNENSLAPVHLSAAGKALWNQGAKIYRRDGHCVTCHQADGNGLPAAGFPPLSQTDWGERKRRTANQTHAQAGFTAPSKFGAKSIRALFR